MIIKFPPKLNLLYNNIEVSEDQLTVIDIAKIKITRQIKKGFNS